MQLASLSERGDILSRSNVVQDPNNMAMDYRGRIASSTISDSSCLDLRLMCSPGLVPLTGPLRLLQDCELESRWCVAPSIVVRKLHQHVSIASMLATRGIRVWETASLRLMMVIQFNINKGKIPR